MTSVTHTQAFEMAQPVAELFPLFSPEGEKHWVPGWDYDNVMGTTELCEDYVFVTQTHDHGSTDAVWVVKHYDPATWRVEFYKIEPGDKVGVVTVKCTELGAVSTKIEVTYKYIALSTTGERFVAEFTEAAYAEFIREWQTLLTDYFAPAG
ncbi:MAG: hypothetical protein OET44_18225 [Gammaproteobacteria bacterium]|nr:hypothetical protein [Gammaproteobacteria bacterium]